MFIYKFFYYLQKYFVTVTAVTSAGSIRVSSDGVTIVTENAALPGVMIYDGKPCNMTGTIFITRK